MKTRASEKKLNKGEKRQKEINKYTLVKLVAKQSATMGLYLFRNLSTMTTTTSIILFVLVLVVSSNTAGVI